MEHMKDHTGTGGNDVMHLHTDGHPGNQVHAWALAGDDHVTIDLNTSDFDHNKHLAHVFLGDGADTLSLDGTLTGFSSGRIEDFTEEDTLLYNGEAVNLWDRELPDNMAIVDHRGEDWLYIKGEEGDAMFALGSAPVDENGEEALHFIAWNEEVPDFPTDTGVPHVPIDEDDDHDVADDDDGGSGMGALAAILGIGIAAVVMGGLV